MYYTHTHRHTHRHTDTHTHTHTMDPAHQVPVLGPPNHPGMYSRQSPKTRDAKARDARRTRLSPPQKKNKKKKFFLLLIIIM